MSQAILHYQEQETSEIAASMALRQMLTGYWLSQAIYVIAKVGAADHLSASSRTCDELSKSLHVDANALYRIMRTLASNGLFVEEEGQRFSLTAIGELLQTGVPGSMRALAIWNGELAYRAWGDVLLTLETGQPALAHALGMKLFDYLKQHHETGRVFNEAMTGLSVQVSQAVVKAYDFSSITKIVDVAGGQGTLAAAILQANPTMQGVLFDMAPVVENARKQLAAMGLGDRAEVIAGDFFEFVPAGGDCYILSSVVHDWNDEQSLRILNNCHKVMEKGDKLLLVECVIPDSPESFFSKLLDLQMLVITGGRERTESQYKALLAAANFRLSNIIQTAAPECIVEAVAI